MDIRSEMRKPVKEEAKKMNNFILENSDEKAKTKEYELGFSA